MQTTMKIPAARLHQFQDLVKQHNLRFKGNPFLIGENAMVTVDGDHLPPGGCNPFFADWGRLTTPIRETAAPAWKRMLRRIGFK